MLHFTSSKMSCPALYKKYDIFNSWKDMGWVVNEDVILNYFHGKIRQALGTPELDLSDKFLVVSNKPIWMQIQIISIPTKKNLI